jgi:hypothetical protein
VFSLDFFWLKLRRDDETVFLQYLLFDEWQMIQGYKSFRML